MSIESESMISMLIWNDDVSRCLTSKSVKRMTNGGGCCFRRCRYGRLEVVVAVVAIDECLWLRKQRQLKQTARLRLVNRQLSDRIDR